MGPVRKRSLFTGHSLRNTPKTDRMRVARNSQRAGAEAARGASIARGALGLDLSGAYRAGKGVRFLSPGATFVLNDIIYQGA